MDGIERLPIQYTLLLTDVYSDMYQAGTFSEVLGNSFVHLIPKQGGEGLRPISLTVCFCKLLETLVKNRLEAWVEEFGLLPDEQGGFRKGRSCIDNLANLVLKTDESFLSGGEVMAAFLDVQGAYDNERPDILLSKLADMGCSGSILRFVKFLTHERTIFAECLGLEARKSYRGVQQSGVLSPLLYLIYVSQITSRLKQHTYVSQYADDIALYVKYKDTDRSRFWSSGTLENSLDVIDQELFQLGLELSPSKSRLVHFSRSGLLPGNSRIRIRDVDIYSTVSVKFLGLHFDYRLDFDK